MTHHNPTLTTQIVASQIILSTRLRIRILEMTDLPALTPILSDPLVCQYIPYQPWKSAADAQAWFHKNAERTKDGRGARFVIERKEDQVLIGTCLYFNYDSTQASAEFGYVLGQDYWKQGYMLEAMTAFVEHIVSELKLTSLNATVETPNRASLELLSKLGFSKVGVKNEDGAELYLLKKDFS